MRKIVLFGILMGFMSSAWGYMPFLHNHSEFRVIANSTDGVSDLSPKNWLIEGHIVGSHALSGKLAMSGIFKLSTHDSSRSELGVLGSYNINKYVTLSLSGNVNDQKSLGANFIIHANIPVSNDMQILPYLKVDNQALGEAGFVYVFDVSGVVFSFGFGYLPPLGVGDNTTHNIRFMLGTGLNKLYKSS